MKKNLLERIKREKEYWMAIFVFVAVLAVFTTLFFWPGSVAAYIHHANDWILGLFDSETHKMPYIDILLEEFTSAFLIISIITVLSDRTNVVLWENVVERNLILPKYFNLVSLTVYTIIILGFSVLNFILDNAFLFAILFVTEMVVLLCMVWKVLKVYFNRKSMEEKIVEEYHSLDKEAKLNKLSLLHNRIIVNISEHDYEDIVHNAHFLLEEFYNLYSVWVRELESMCGNGIEMDGEQKKWDSMCETMSDKCLFTIEEIYDENPVLLAQIFDKFGHGKSNSEETYSNVVESCSRKHYLKEIQNKLPKVFYDNTFTKYVVVKYLYDETSADSFILARPDYTEREIKVYTEYSDTLYKLVGKYNEKNNQAKSFENTSCFFLKSNSIILFLHKYTDNPASLNVFFGKIENAIDNEIYNLLHANGKIHHIPDKSDDNYYAILESSAVDLKDSKCVVFDKDTADMLKKCRKTLKDNMREQSNEIRAIYSKAISYMDWLIFMYKRHLILSYNAYALWNSYVAMRDNGRIEIEQMQESVPDEFM